MKKRAGSDIHHDHFVGLLKDPVGDGFADTEAGNLEDLMAGTGEVLHVHSGENVHATFEKDLHVLPAALALGAGSVGVSEVVNDADLGCPAQNADDVKFFGIAAAASDTEQRNGLELFGAFVDVGTAL